MGLTKFEIAKRISKELKDEGIEISSVPWIQDDH